MRTAGIICECNPPHAGHEYLIREARRNADCAVCLMSGPFVQRGEAAVLTPHARAEILLGMGADLVAELPFPYAAAGAESFAEAGVSILTRLGADELWFGSESGDMELLERAARAADDPAFRADYAERLNADPEGTAALYFSMLAERCGLSEPLAPNDILGTAYLRAVRGQGSRLRPRCVARVGTPHAEARLTDDPYPSASALRNAILSGNLRDVYAKMPDFERNILEREAEEGRFPISLDRAAPALLAFLRLADLSAFDGIAEAAGGVGGRLKKAANEATDVGSLLSLAATKKYPFARLRRGLLFSMLGVTRADLNAPPAYLRPLAMNAVGEAFLAQVRRTAAIPVCPTVSGIPKTAAAKRQKILSDRARALYALCFPAPMSPAELIRQPVLRKPAEI